MDEKTKKYLKYGLHVAILLGVIWAAAKYINGEEVIAALRQFNYSLAPLMLALSVATLLLKATRFHFLLRPFAPDLPSLTIYKAYIAGQGATVLPGGIAARAGLLKQIDVPVSEGSVAVLVNSLIDQAFFIVIGLITALWYPQARLPGLIILAVLAIASLLFLFEPSRNWIARMAERLAERLNVAEQWHNFLSCLPSVLTKKILLAGFVATTLAFAFFVIVLRLALQGVGLSVAYPAVLLAFILPTMLGRIVPIPAGLGVTEATMVGFLTTVAAVDAAAAVAAVAIFRIAAIFIPILIGALVYFFWWRGEEELTRSKRKMETARASNPDL